MSHHTASQVFEHFRLLPNQITLFRLLCVPVLWVLALLGEARILGALLLLAVLTDPLDGFVARRLGQCTEFGSKFDSFADNLLIPSAIVWLIMLRPAALGYSPALVGAGIAIYAASMLVGWVKFRRIGNLHLYSAKLAATLVWVAVVYEFLSDNPRPDLFYAAMGLFILTCAEQLIVQLTRSRVDEHIGSILVGPLRRLLRWVTFARSRGAGP